jgi:hypothetical protein
MNTVVTETLETKAQTAQQIRETAEDLHTELCGNVSWLGEVLEQIVCAPDVSEYPGARMKAEAAREFVNKWIDAQRDLAELDSLLDDLRKLTHRTEA